MSESQADCQRLPFAAVILVAVGSVAAASAAPAVPAFGVDSSLWSRALLFVGLAILALGYVDAFRSRCIRSYMTITLPVLALLAAAPLFGSDRAAWGYTESLWINAIIVLVLLLGFLHFALHTMPFAWRHSLTPARSALFGLGLAAGGALYWEYRGGGAANLDKSLPLLADGLGILLGAAIFWALMLHRLRED
jgi:phosphoglycerol transferase MdoB-like AlkP superfamily enzyme